MVIIVDLFEARTCAWFRETLGEPTAVQREGWPAIARGENVLISAPTGTGKTLTAFLWFIDRLSAALERGALGDETNVLYISPLKALGNDIRENLKRPIEGLKSALTVAVRNGDTTAAERRRIATRPPHILITTPESLYLMLTSASGRRVLKTVRAVIVDELHAMMNSKRGVHLMLSLERLDALCAAPAQRIGLSATIRPLDEAARYLGGVRPAQVVAPRIEKAADVRLCMPVPDMRVLPEGSVWPEIAREIYDAACAVRTVLVFCQGRATTEKLSHLLNELGGEDFARTHHGSVSKERRLEAEARLKAGVLKVLCATSSMELGIDVGEVDLVVQIASPQFISAATQRLGRAGHRPSEVSRMRFYPRMNQDLIEQALIMEGMRRGAIERARIPTLCLDVLAQHLVSMAAADDYAVADALAIVRRCHCYRTLDEETLKNVLRMLAGDYEHERDRPVSPRVQYDRLRGVVTGNNYTRMLALSSGGTIPDRGLYAVVLEDGVTRLGELDEEFVFEARLGDKFFLGAFAWQIVRIERDRVVVRASDARGAQSPFWKGDGTGRAFETGLLFGAQMRALEGMQRAGRMLEALDRLVGDEDAALNAARYLSGQIEAVGCLASDRVIVLEAFCDEAGDHQLLIHSIFGGQVNIGLSLLLRDAAARVSGMDVRVWSDDDGILLHMLGGAPVPQGLFDALPPERAREDIARLLPASQLFSMSFRYAAYRALMMGVRPGGRVPLWVQRLRGAEAFARALDEACHPLLIETMRECMSEFIDAPAIETVLRDIRRGHIRLVSASPDKPSPMSLPLRRAVEAEMMYDYSPMPSGAKALALNLSLLPGAGVPDALEGIRPDEEQLGAAGAGRPAPKDAEQLHERLMIEGDLRADELNAPQEWVERLAGAGRALYIEPGLWICTEQEGLYREALTLCAPQAVSRVLRRCLRYRGPHALDALAERYLLPPELCAEALEALIQENALLRVDDVYVHREVYERAQRLTVAARRREIRTAPPEAYAAFLYAWHQAAGSPANRLRQAIGTLSGCPLPAELWEGIVLPARVPQYRPQLLDELLQKGEATWRVLPGERPLVAFYPPDGIDWEKLPPEEGLGEGERAIYGLLLRRGASFAHAISAGLAGAPVGDALKAMADAGVLVCDSFAPLRRRASAAGSAKQAVRSKLSVQDAGRWELARAPREPDLRERLRQVFRVFGIACRESASALDLDWQAALTLLRTMEYTGEVRRGYFVSGLSGAQFVEAQSYARIAASLAEPSEECVCVSAADPCQAWGRILRRPEAADFLCVPGTAVVMKRGEVALLCERQGASLRAFRAPPDAYEALAQAFREGRVFRSLRMLTIKRYPTEAEPLLAQAGFLREMRDWVMWK